MYGTQIAAWKSARERLQAVQQTLSGQLPIVTRFIDAEGNRWSSIGLISGTQYTLIEALLQVSHAARMFNSIRLTKGTPLPDAAWRDAERAVTQLETAMTALTSSLDLVANESRPMKINPGGDVVISGTGEALAPFAGPSQGLVSAADALINASAQIVAVAAATGRVANPAEKAVIGDLVGETGAALHAAETASAGANKSLQSAEAAKAAIENTQAELTTLLAGADAGSKAKLAELDSAVAQIAAANEKATANAAVIDSKFTEVNQIEAQAQEAHRKLTAYAATLTATEARVAGSEKKAADAVQRMDDQSESVAKLIERAEAMVSGATVAGLATAFAVERDDLDKKLSWAFVWFCVGVVSIVAASFFFAAYLVNMHLVNGKVVTTDAPGYQITLAGLLSRTIVLVGPLWFTQFSASRYRQIFDLRQNYSHKYNMAFSVEGFKKEAEKYREEIAFWVFTTIGANPARKTKGARMMDDLPLPLGGSPIEEPKNLIERLFTPFRGTDKP